MKPICERCSIIMIGAWNQAIFTPPWVQTILLDGTIPQVEIALTAQGLATQFVHEGVKFTVIPSQAQLVLGSYSDAALLQLEVIALRLLRRLADTPVHGVGINFGFEVTEPSMRLEELFAAVYGTKFAEAGWSVLDVKITQRLGHPLRPVNLSLEKSSAGTVIIDFNHHYDVSTAREAAERIEKNVLASRSNALQLANQLYGISQVSP